MIVRFNVKVISTAYHTLRVGCSPVTDYENILFPITYMY